MLALSVKLLFYFLTFLNLVGIKFISGKRFTRKISFNDKSKVNNDLGSLNYTEIY